MALSHLSEERDAVLAATNVLEKDGSNPPSLSVEDWQSLEKVLSYLASCLKEAAIERFIPLGMCPDDDDFVLKPCAGTNSSFDGMGNKFPHHLSNIHSKTF